MADPDQDSDAWIPPESTTADGLSIRPWAPGDGAALVAAVTRSIDHLSPWMAWADPDDTVPAAEARVRRFHGLWHAREDFVLSIWDGDELVGGTGYHLRWGGLASRVAEVGMWIAAQRAHRGVGTRVLQALTEWALSDAWPSSASCGCAMRTTGPAQRSPGRVATRRRACCGGRRPTVTAGRHPDA